MIYEQYDAIAFALEIEVEGKTMISLNPGAFFIEKFIDEREDINSSRNTSRETSDNRENTNENNDNQAFIDSEKE